LQRTPLHTHSRNRLAQGDILRDIRWLEYANEVSGKIEVSWIVFPLAIILTQDCDLEQDVLTRSEPQKTEDKMLISVLLAPLYNVEHVYAGEHLSELKIRKANHCIDKTIHMEPLPKSGNTGNFLKNNERPRYHYLEFDEDIPIVPSVIDFKHYFTATADYLHQVHATNFVASVAPLFREDIAIRFASYLSRVGLPSSPPVDLATIVGSEAS
jgi:hypothetical protein